MRPVRSLCCRTDIAITKWDGVVTNHPRYVVVRTPSNPNFVWGNYLLYPAPPTLANGAAEGDESWLADAVREFPNAKTHALTWDAPGERGETAPFEARGFGVETSVVLTAARLTKPPRWNPEVVVDELDFDRDTAAAVQVLSNAFDANRYGTRQDLETFVRRQLARYASIARSGAGTWYAARIDGTLAGVLGVVSIDELGRYQLVGTDPKYGRRGVCSTLVYEAGSRALSRPECTTLVMAADDEYHAARVYESVGFTPEERLFAVIRKPKRA